MTEPVKKVNVLQIDYAGQHERIIGEMERRARQVALRELEALLGVEAHIEHRHILHAGRDYMRSYPQALEECVKAAGFKPTLPMRLDRNDYRSEQVARQVEPYAGFIAAVKTLQAELEGWRNGSFSTDNSPALGGQKETT